MVLWTFTTPVSALRNSKHGHKSASKRAKRIKIIFGNDFGLENQRRYFVKLPSARTKSTEKYERKIDKNIRKTFISSKDILDFIRPVKPTKITQTRSYRKVERAVKRFWARRRSVQSSPEKPNDLGTDIADNMAMDKFGHFDDSDFKLAWEEAMEFFRHISV